MREGSMQTKMALTERDLLRVQAANPECRVELRDGKIIVMSPSSYGSDAVATRLAILLGRFVLERKLGVVTGSSAGFRLPNGDIVSPDLSFVSTNRLHSIEPNHFANLAPDLAVEVRSPSDRVRELEEKLGMLREFGAKATMLVDPKARTVTLDAGEAPRRVLANADLLELPDLLPGWSIRVSELWLEAF